MLVRAPVTLDVFRLEDHSADDEFPNGGERHGTHRELLAPLQPQVRVIVTRRPQSIFLRISPALLYPKQLLVGKPNATYIDLSGGAGAPLWHHLHVFRPIVALFLARIGWVERLKRLLALQFDVFFQHSAHRPVLT